MVDEVFRQTVHFLMGILGALILVTVQPGTALIFLSLVLFTGFIILDVITRGYDIPIPGLVSLLDEVKRRGRVPMKGTLAYGISALLCYTVFGRVLHRHRSRHPRYPRQRLDACRYQDREAHTVPEKIG